MLTQAALLTWITALAQSLLLLVDERFVGSAFVPGEAGSNPVALVIAAAAFWLLVAIVIALIGLAEARAGDRTGSRAAHRRAALSRFWAGMTAIIGVATAVTRSAGMPDGSYGRVLEPIVGEAALVVISVVLIERAFRRGATSFMYAAALGLILALTDFNVSYLSSSTEVALLIEGLILLAVGVAANRLRKRIGADDEPDRARWPGARTRRGSRRCDRPGGRVVVASARGPAAPPSRRSPSRAAGAPRTSRTGWSRPTRAA